MLSHVLSDQLLLSVFYLLFYYIVLILISILIFFSCYNLNETRLVILPLFYSEKKLFVKIFIRLKSLSKFISPCMFSSGYSILDSLVLWLDPRYIHCLIVINGCKYFVRLSNNQWTRGRKYFCLNKYKTRLGLLKERTKGNFNLPQNTDSRTVDSQVSRWSFF